MVRQRRVASPHFRLTSLLHPIQKEKSVSRRKLLANSRRGSTACRKGLLPTTLKACSLPALVSLLPSKSPCTIISCAQLTSSSLSTGCADNVLELAVNDAFKKFGKCYTKIRRDHKNMPFAFVQYEVWLVDLMMSSCKRADILPESKHCNPSHQRRSWASNRGTQMSY